MPTLYQKLEATQHAAHKGDPDSIEELIDALHDPNWEVRYAAAIALGDIGSRSSRALPALIALLAQEDAAPIYSQVNEIYGGPAGSNIPMPAKGHDVDPVTLECWRRRGRIKQAVIWTLAQIGQSSPEILSYLNRYAIDQKEDYSVRAAACRALQFLGDEGSKLVLEKASGDDEWCTSCEAKKSLKVLQKSV